ERLGARSATLEQARAEADAVIIATPPGLHREHVELFLKPGRVVVCEKPFVGSRRDAEELIQRANDCGCALFVGHFRRTFPALRLAKEFAATGALGALRRISVSEGFRF